MAAGGSRGGFESPVGGEETRDAMLVGAIVLRAFMIWSLPLVRYLMRVPVFDRLLLYSYAPRVPIGRNVQLWGLLYDPELTHIGDGAVIGGDSTLSAHSLTTKSDGSLLYLSAPINIGPRAVIGANSRVALGALIAADAIILPGSSVLPYAQIAAAIRFGAATRRPLSAAATWPRMANCRKSDNLQNCLSAPVAASLKIHDERMDDANEDALDCELKQIVAATLNLPSDRVTPDFSCDDCGGMGFARTNGDRRRTLQPIWHHGCLGRDVRTAIDRRLARTCPAPQRCQGLR